MNIETTHTLSIIAICTSWIPFIGWLYALITVFLSFKALQKHQSDQEFLLAKKSLRNALISILLIPLSFIIYGILGLLGLPLFGM